MTQLVFCGQAPSRIGDGRPFSGPSGRRLSALMMLRDYEHLASQVTLTNIFEVPAERREAKGDEFDKAKARVEGVKKIATWADQEETFIVVACGHEVYEALTGVKKAEFFKGRSIAGVEVWCFPHPSGISTYWNTRAHVLLAANFLTRLTRRSGIVMHR
jgi:uracil-DNA glycosylase